MAEFTPEIAEDVLVACTAAAEEASQTLSSALDSELTLTAGETGTWDGESPPEGFDGPGLVIVLTVGEQAAVILVPEASGLLPDWYAAPDPTGESKLATLAQELGMQLVPEDFMPEDFKAVAQENLSEAIARGKPVENAGTIALPLQSGDKSGIMTMIWPVAAPGEIIEESASEEEPAEAENEATETASEPEAPTPAANQPGRTPLNFEEGVNQLPPYTRSLLRIKMTLSVTLAEKKQPVSQILSLGTGSIIQFNKMCEEMLDLEIGGNKVAKGEAVKVGDKFGLRITAITMPDEKFLPLHAG